MFSELIEILYTAGETTVTLINLLFIVGGIKLLSMVMEIVCLYFEKHTTGTIYDIPRLNILDLVPFLNTLVYIGLLASIFVFGVFVFHIT